LIKHNGKTIKKFGKYKVVDCKICKFIHVTPIPSNKELSVYYDSEYYQKVKPNFILKNENEIDYWNLVFDEKLDTIEKLVSSKSKRILDIGSGPGFFLRRAKRRGWDVIGIEPSPLASDYANKQKINTIQKFFHEVDINEIGKFDAIHTFDVLEHVNDPITIIKKSYSLLKKGGVIVIEVPNDFNPLQKLVQKNLKKTEYWITLSNNSKDIQHLNYFNFSSISDLIKRLGFKIIMKESTFPLELFLLMGQDYIKNPKIGEKIHLERIQFEKNFVKRKEIELKRTIYQKLAEIGIGRTAIIYAKKS
jgi:2-polyprenyl-3-methyl-5-hydroxy-6-metoxy-1,4-benzoquinol methylase